MLDQNCICEKCGATRAAFPKKAYLVGLLDIEELSIVDESDFSVWVIDEHGNKVARRKWTQYHKIVSSRKEAAEALRANLQRRQESLDKIWAYLAEFETETATPNYHI